MFKKIILSLFLLICTIKSWGAYNLTNEDKNIIDKIIKKIEIKTYNEDYKKHLKMVNKIIVPIKILKNRYKDNERIYFILQEVQDKIQTDLKNEVEIIKKAILEKIPSIKEESFFNNLDNAHEYKKYNKLESIDIHLKNESYAIGEFCSSNNYRGISYKGWLNCERFFSAKVDDKWIIINYWNYKEEYYECKDFYSYNFPTNMIPDCYDSQKDKFVNTMNPNEFNTSWLKKEDKDKIKEAYLNFQYENENGENYSKYNSSNLDKLYINISTLISSNYLAGSMIKLGVTWVTEFWWSYFLAVKTNNEWKIIYEWQDYPPCSLIKTYNLPKEFIPFCYDENDNKIIN